MVEVSRAIILSIYDFEERDGIIKALFEDGRVMEIYAQGIQVENSKNMINLQLFSIVELEYFQKKERLKAKLKKSNTQKHPTSKDIRDLNMFFLIESLFRGLEHVEKEVFITIEHLINEIEYKTINISELFFLMKLLLRENGININFWSCSSCGRQDRIDTFDLKENGLLCIKHKRNRDSVPPATLRKIIQIFESNNINEISKIMLLPDEVKFIKEQFIHYLSDILGLYTEHLNNV